MTGYENVRRLTHEHLLPSLERCVVLVSRLRGLSRHQISNVTLGLSTQSLDKVIDTVNCLQLLAHHVLIASGAELRQFLAFSAWLRHEIDTQTMDASTPDNNDDDTDVDYVSTLEYIQGAMTQSRLQLFFGLQETAEKIPQWDLDADGTSLFDLYKRELKCQSVESLAVKRLAGLDTLISHLHTLCNGIFSSIAETQRRNVRFGSPISLGSGVPTCMDAKMAVEVNTQRHYETAFAEIERIRAILPVDPTVYCSMQL